LIITIDYDLMSLHIHILDCFENPLTLTHTTHTTPNYSDTSANEDNLFRNHIR